MRAIRLGPRLDADLQGGGGGLSSWHNKVYSVIYDSGSFPRRAFFSPRETSPTTSLSTRLCVAASKKKSQTWQRGPRRASLPPRPAALPWAVASLSTAALPAWPSVDQSQSCARQARGVPPTLGQLRRYVKRLLKGFVFKANRLLYHSTLGLTVIKRRR